MLKEPYMLHVAVGAASLSLEADAGEAFIVRDIIVYAPSRVNASVFIDREKVGWFRIAGQLGNHLPFAMGRTQHAHDWITSARVPADVVLFGCLQNAGGSEVVAGNMIGSLAASTTYRRVGELASGIRIGRTILGLLGDLRIFTGYPVEEGMEFRVDLEGGAGTANDVIVVEYEIWEPKDISAEMENGPASDRYLYLAYGSAGANINVDGETVLDTSELPAEFPDFPFGAVVPARGAMQVFGILASDFAPAENDGVNYLVTRYLRLIHERTTLWDKNRNGLLMRAVHETAQGDMDHIGEGYSLAGQYSDVDAKPPFMLPVPLLVDGGEELSVWWNTERGAAGQNMTTAEHQIALILKYSRSKVAVTPAPVRGPVAPAPPYVATGAGPA